MEAKWPELLEQVERGETVVVTRDGRPVARLIPDEESRRQQARVALAELDRIRKTLPRITFDEIRSAIREGRE